MYLNRIISDLIKRKKKRTWEDFKEIKDLKTITSK